MRDLGKWSLVVMFHYSNPSFFAAVILLRAATEILCLQLELRQFLRTLQFAERDISSSQVASLQSHCSFGDCHCYVLNCAHRDMARRQELKKKRPFLVGINLPSRLDPQGFLHNENSSVSRYKKESGRILWLALSAFLFNQFLEARPIEDKMEGEEGLLSMTLLGVRMGWLLLYCAMMVCTIFLASVVGVSWNLGWKAAYFDVARLSMCQGRRRKKKHITNFRAKINAGENRKREREKERQKEEIESKDAIKCIRDMRLSSPTSPISQLLLPSCEDDVSMQLEESLCFLHVRIAGNRRSPITVVYAADPPNCLESIDALVQQKPSHPYPKQSH